MTWIGKQASCYRGYLTDERSLAPLTIVLATVVVVWLLVYLVAAVAEAHQDPGARQAASVTFIRDRPPANLLPPALSPATMQPRTIRSRHTELTPQSDKRRRRGRGRQTDPGLDPLTALPEIVEV